MLRVAQECFSRRLACEHARLSFDAKLELEARDTGNEADDGLRKVDVEIVADNVPLCGGSGAAEQVAENRVKSFSVLVLPTTPSTPPVVTLKAAIRA